MNHLSTNEIVHIISFLDSLSIAMINRYFYDIVYYFFNPLSYYGKQNRMTFTQNLQAKKMAKWLSGYKNKTYHRCFLSPITRKLLLAYSIQEEHLIGFYYLLHKNVNDIELNHFSVNRESFCMILDKCLQLTKQDSFSVSYHLMSNDQCDDLCNFFLNPLFKFERLQISNMVNLTEYQKNYISKTLQKMNSVKRFCIRYCNILTWVAEVIQTREHPFDVIEIKSVQHPYGISQICDAISFVGHPISLDLSHCRISINDFTNVLGLLTLNLLESINVSSCFLDDKYAIILYYALQYMLPENSILHTIFIGSNLFSKKMKTKLDDFDVIFM